MMIRDKSVIQDETEQKLDEADQAAAANPSRYAEADVSARARERSQAYVEQVYNRVLFLA